MIMKTIKNTIGVMLLTGLLVFTSCSKEKDTPKPKVEEKTYIVALASGNSISAVMTINGVVKTDGVYTGIVKGSVIKIDDVGNDIVHPPIYLYPTNGGSPIVGIAGYTEEDPTVGSIMVDGVFVATNFGEKDDTHLIYTIR